MPPASRYGTRRPGCATGAHHTHPTVPHPDHPSHPRAAAPRVQVTLRVSFSELLGAVASAALVLRGEGGLREGDLCALLAHNSARWPGLRRECPAGAYAASCPGYPRSQ